MKSVIFINSQLNTNYRSNLFHLFSSQISKDFDVSTSFKSIESYDYHIFTSISEYETKLRKSKNIKSFGLILDGDRIEESHIAEILTADFCFIVGSNRYFEENLEKFPTITHVQSLYNDSISKNPDPKLVTAEYRTLPLLYEKFLKGQYGAEITQLHILMHRNESSVGQYKDLFSKLNVTLHFYIPSYSLFQSILSNTSSFLSPTTPSLKALYAPKQQGATSRDIPIAEFSKTIFDSISQYAPARVSSDVVNIVCYNPTYLFKDLVERFVGQGCVHSDFPMPGAKSYIWMRPQEIWHYEYLLSGMGDKEISESYKTAFNKCTEKGLDILSIKEHSVAIHHGTCYEPLYQFNYRNLARSLRTVSKVVGVCEFEECYGPSHVIANKENFIFVPIGYDDKVFNHAFWKTESKPRQAPLKIGFVGRAYGTTNKSLLQRSQLAEPKGYRKGGDICLGIGLRLNAAQIPFELHILGQNWEDLTEQCDKYKIPYHYYARDKNITYHDYPKVYSQMDILLIAARCEGGPVSAIEALSLGVNVVSTNVGVVKYLSNDNVSQGGCRSFDYDKKWHIADTELAVQHIEEIHNSEVSAEDRESIRQSVAIYTTDFWVESIVKAALTV